MNALRATARKLIPVGILAVSLAGAPSTGQDQPKTSDKASQEKVRELEKKQEDLQKMVGELNKEIKDLRKGEAGQGEKKEIAKGKTPDIKKRKALEDRQTPAPRLDDLTMHPDYRGFIPIPNTRAMIRFNARPRVDVAWTNGQGDKNRFITARIPVQGEASYDGPTLFNINAKATNLIFEVVAPEMPGDPRFYYQNDFFGAGDKEYEFRVQHLYGQLYNLVIGQTYSVFEDPDVWPDTVDYEGPNSMIWARRPLIHYMVGLEENLKLTFGIEQPNSYVPDLFGVPSPAGDVSPYSRYPDAAAQIRWQDAEVGHLELAGIVREIGANSATFGRDEVIGGGVNLSGSLQVSGNDVILGQLTYGKGIGGLCNDTSFEKSDAAFDLGGHLQALRYFGALLAFTHTWSDRFQSTASYGYVRLGSQPTQGPFAYDVTQYASANLVVQPFKEFENVAMGLEFLWGEKEVRNGNEGNLWRVQFGVRYSIF